MTAARQHGEEDGLLEFWLEGVRPDQISSLGLRTEYLGGEILADGSTEEGTCGVFVLVPADEQVRTCERLLSLTGVMPFCSEGL